MKTKTFRNRKGKGMELLTAQLLKDLPTRDMIQGDDPTVYAKLFDPAGWWECLVLGYSPKSRLIYGVVNGEAGDVPLDELIAREKMGSGIERRTSFNRKRLSECA